MSTLYKNGKYEYSLPMYAIYKSLPSYKCLFSKWPCYIGVSKFKLDFGYMYGWEHFYYPEVL